MTNPRPSLVGSSITDTLIEPNKRGTIVWSNADRSDLLVSWSPGHVTRLHSIERGRYVIELPE